MDENVEAPTCSFGNDADNLISHNANNSLSDEERADQFIVAMDSTLSPSSESSTLPLSTSSSTLDPDSSPPPPDYESSGSSYSPGSLLPPLLPGPPQGVVCQGLPPPYIADLPEYSEQRPLSK